MSVLSQREVITRKPHVCWGCASEYPAGTHMTITAEVDGKQVDSVYWCDTCKEYIQRHSPWGSDEYGIGEIGAHREEWNEIKTELEALDHAE